MVQFKLDQSARFLPLNYGINQGQILQNSINHLVSLSSEILLYTSHKDLKIRNAAKRLKRFCLGLWEFLENMPHKLNSNHFYWLRYFHQGVIDLVHSGMCNKMIAVFNGLVHRKAVLYQLHYDLVS